MIFKRKKELSFKRKHSTFNEHKFGDMQQDNLDYITVTQFLCVWKFWSNHGSFQTVLLNQTKNQFFEFVMPKICDAQLFSNNERFNVAVAYKNPFFIKKI